MAGAKDIPVVRSFYTIPGLASTYHFLWAWGGAAVHRAPSRKLCVIGVTGTKGKTTTLELVNAMLEAAGKRTALLSSLRVKIGGETHKNQTGNSMPGRAYLQRFLRNAARAECEYALIEVTSQGIAAHRHRFIDWKIGVITNLSPEHIEAHGSFENYRAAKLDFLKYVVRGGGEVLLNRDDAHFVFFSAALGGGGAEGIAGNISAFSQHDDWLAHHLSEMKGAVRAAATPPAAAPKFFLSDFNEQNIAAAAAVAKKFGIADAPIRAALEHFAGVPGRMEFVVSDAYTVVVDYAHTPDSLEAAYKAVKPKPNEAYPDPRLICILGSAGGGRDRWKRPRMGQIAAEYCDELVLTDEDPYDEDPKKIIEEIRAGVTAAARAPRGVYEILDRRDAVKKAFALARVGDVVIGTGKGSEDWIHVAQGKRIPWNEKKVFEEALAEKARGDSRADAAGKAGE